MAYFPFFVDIKNKNCLVVGGGKVALRKIEKLVPFGPIIKVVSPEVCNEISNMKDLTIEFRKFNDGDIDGADFVISATDDKQLNCHIYDLCSKKSILVNTVDDKENCSFIFPALVNKDNITAAVSTGGKSPLTASYIRKRIESIIDSNLSETVEVLGAIRDDIKCEIKTEEQRKQFYQWVLDKSLKEKINIKTEHSKLLIKEFKEQNEN